MTIYAEATDYTVQAEGVGELSSGLLTLYPILVDEAGDTLVDEAGDTLVSEELTTVYGEVIYAQGTDYTVHVEE